MKNAKTGEQRSIFGLFGAGGFGREVMPLVFESISDSRLTQSQQPTRLFFVERDLNAATSNGHPIISSEEFFDLPCSDRRFNIAIADSIVRERLVSDCLGRGAMPFSIQSRHALIYDHNEIGEGAILCAYSVVTSNTKIGKYFHANLYSYVAHDCLIGDFVTFAPNVHCNGHVHIGRHAYIGAGAVIKEGSKDKPILIGEGAVVGMGAVVTADVPAYTTVIGNPARFHTRVKKLQ
jgi:sugar O-acyltransferase (sialic acid O-acetyltransferase NeuD family)